MELAIDGEGRHELLQVEGVRHVCAVEDEVEGECPWLGPVFVFGADEFLGAEVQGIVLFVGAVGDGIGFSAKGGCP